jgi:hypothetical protein
MDKNHLDEKDAGPKNIVELVSNLDYRESFIKHMDKEFDKLAQQIERFLLPGEVMPIKNQRGEEVFLVNKPLDDKELDDNGYV